MIHFRELSPDIRERLAERGIDPEASAEAWRAAIRDGSFPLSASGLPLGPRDQYRRPGVPHVPAPLPLAVVVP